MAQVRFVFTHATWEDVLGIGLGVAIGLIPLFAGVAPPAPYDLALLLIGVLVVAFSAIELVDLHRWEEVGLLFSGLALIGLPFLGSFASLEALPLWHYGLGAAVCALAVVELWQDWRATDKQLAAHGN